MSGDSCPAGPSVSVTVSAVDTTNDPSDVRAHSREGALGQPGSILLVGLLHLISAVRGIGPMRRGGEERSQPAAEWKFAERKKARACIGLG